MRNIYLQSLEVVAFETNLPWLGREQEIKAIDGLNLSLPGRNEYAVLELKFSDLKRYTTSNLSPHFFLSNSCPLPPKGN